MKGYVVVTVFRNQSTRVSLQEEATSDFEAQQQALYDMTPRDQHQMAEMRVVAWDDMDIVGRSRL